jgi:hypothetical protein
MIITQLLGNFFRNGQLNVPPSHVFPPAKLTRLYRSIRCVLQHLPDGSEVWQFPYSSRRLRRLGGFSQNARRNSKSGDMLTRHNREQSMTFKTGRELARRLEIRTRKPEVEDPNRTPNETSYRTDNPGRRPDIDDSIRRSGQPPIEIQNRASDTSTDRILNEEVGRPGTDCRAENMSEQFWITMVFLLLSFAADVFLLSLGRWNVEHLDCGRGDSVPCIAVIAKPWYVP